MKGEFRRGQTGQAMLEHTSVLAMLSVMVILLFVVVGPIINKSIGQALYCIAAQLDTAAVNGTVARQ